MKASLLIGAILLMSLAMANEQADNPLPETKGGNAPALVSNRNATTNSSIMVFEGPAFFLLPFVLMVIHLLHMY